MSQTPRPSTETLLQHEPFIRAVVRGLLFDEGRVQDVVQETWLTALRRPPRAGGSLRAWLARVAENLAKDSYRNTSRRTIREQAVARPESVESVDVTYERLAAQREVVDIVLALKEPYKGVVLLSYYQGLSAAEIAERLGRSAATVRSQLSRAHEILRCALDSKFADQRSVWGALLVPLPVEVPLLESLGKIWATTTGKAASAVLLTAALALGLLPLLLGTKEPALDSLPALGEPVAPFVSPSAEVALATGSTEPGIGSLKPAVTESQRRTAEDRRSAPAQGSESESLPAESTQEPIPTPPPLTIAVACEDPKGVRISGCLVQARPAAGEELLASAITDSKGLAVLQVPAGEQHVLRAEFEGANSGDRTLQPWERDDLKRRESGVLTLVLYPQVNLLGVVKLDTGATLEGAVVTLRQVGIMFGGSDRTPVEPVTTNAQGVFTISTDGVPGGFRMEAVHAGRHSQVESLVLPWGEEPTLVLVVPEADYNISGVVRGSAGCGVADARVALVPLATGKSCSHTTTDSTGAFQFELSEPGEFQLAARNGSCMSATPLTTSLDLEQRSAVVELFLQPTLSVSGRIEWSSGESLQDVLVAAYPVKSSLDEAWLLDSGFREITEVANTQTDERGAFQLDGFRNGYDYDVVCLPDASRRECLVREHGVRASETELVIVVDEARIRAGVFAGTLTRSGQETPVTSAQFTLQKKSPDRPWGGGRMLQPILNTEGFRLEGLEIGHQFFARVHVAHCAELSVGPWTATAQEQTVDLVFGLDGELTVRIQNMGTEPLRAWLISVTEHGEGPRRPLTSNPKGDGSARFWPLAAGQYYVSARMGDRTLGPFDVEIQPGGKHEIEIDAAQK